MSRPSTPVLDLDAVEEALDALTIDERLEFYRATDYPKINEQSAVLNLEITWLNLSTRWVVDDATNVEAQKGKAELLCLLLEQIVQMRSRKHGNRLHEFLANLQTIIALTRAAEGELTAWWCSGLTEAAKAGTYEAFREEYERSTSRVYALLWHTREAALKQRKKETELEPDGLLTADQLRKDSCKQSQSVADAISLAHQGITCNLWVSAKEKLHLDHRGRRPRGG